MLVFRVLCTGGGLTLALFGLALFLTQLEGQLNRASNNKFSFGINRSELQSKLIFPAMMLVGLMGVFAGVLVNERPWTGILPLVFGGLMLPFAFMLCWLMARFERVDNGSISRAAYQRMSLVLMPPLAFMAGGLLHL